MCVVKGDCGLDPEADTPLDPEADTPAVDTATETGSTYPTGMHSCCVKICHLPTWTKIPKRDEPCSLEYVRFPEQTGK